MNSILENRKKTRKGGLIFMGAIVFIVSFFHLKRNKKENE